jgi:hypothetical protein
MSTPPTVGERLAGLVRAVRFGLRTGKSNIIADLDVLAELLDQRDGLLASLKALLAPGIGTYADGEGFAELLRSEDDDTMAAIAAARVAIASAEGKEAPK